MHEKYFQEKIEKLKPHLFKTATNTIQGYIFGCMVGVFSPSTKPTFRSMHESGKSFAKISAIYSATESALEIYWQRDSPFNNFVSGAVAGGLGINDKSGKSVLIGVTSFGLYSGLSTLFSARGQR